MLFCNDLNTDVQIRSTDPESFGAETIFTNDCRAVCFPSKRGGSALKEEKNLFLSLEPHEKEVKLDLQVPLESKYTPYEMDDKKTIFAKVTSLSSSQKLVSEDNIKEGRL